MSQSPKSLRATTAELDDLRALSLGCTDQIVRAESAIGAKPLRVAPPNRSPNVTTAAAQLVLPTPELKDY
jgi:hypothetical protein